ncbi:MAG: hypothetical protein FWH15_02440 [Betaproteobacteria bacterium]|nr:hypothetical protein [Betaproteobacteria bacterium]
MDALIYSLPHHTIRSRREALFLRTRGALKRAPIIRAGGRMVAMRRGKRIQGAS